MAATRYYKELVGVVEEYLGPAAERFVNRQVEFHLEKKPESITRSDVIKLKHTIQVALGVLVADKVIVEEAMSKMDDIAKE